MHIKGSSGFWMGIEGMSSGWKGPAARITLAKNY
jgi:hypothetical protein